MVNESPKRLDEGGGEIVGLGLADVIQIQNHNRFSGCISVESSGGSGLLFFRDGEVIHAEQGRHIGEEAFLEIVAWPPGKYRLQPNVATTRSTIQKNSQHLLLEAHRILDERRAGRGAPPASPAPGSGTAPPAAAPGPRAPMRASDVLEKLRRVPGVEYAALTGKDGAKVADDSYEAEVLGGQSVFLSMIGNQLGAVFQTGQMLSAAVHGTKKHLLLFSTKSHFLSVVVKGDAQPGPVEAEVRKILSAR